MAQSAQGHSIKHLLMSLFTLAVIAFGGWLFFTFGPSYLMGEYLTLVEWLWCALIAAFAVMIVVDPLRLSIRGGYIADFVILAAWGALIFYFFNFGGPVGIFGSWAQYWLWGLMGVVAVGVIVTLVRLVVYEARRATRKASSAARSPSSGLSGGYALSAMAPSAQEKGGSGDSPSDEAGVSVGNAEDDNAEDDNEDGDTEEGEKEEGGSGVEGNDAEGAVAEGGCSEEGAADEDADSAEDTADEGGDFEQGAIAEGGDSEEGAAGKDSDSEEGAADEDGCSEEDAADADDASRKDDDADGAASTSQEPACSTSRWAEWDRRIEAQQRELSLRSAGVLSPEALVNAFSDMQLYRYLAGAFVEDGWTVCSLPTDAVGLQAPAFSACRGDERVIVACYCSRNEPSADDVRLLDDIGDHEQLSGVVVAAAGPVSDEACRFAGQKGFTLWRADDLVDFM